MKISAVLSGLAVGALTSAEPIPHDARLSVRALEKRVQPSELFGDNLWGDNGNAKRQWWWTKLAYDEQAHKADPKTGLEISKLTPDDKWKGLAGDEITLYGFHGECLEAHGLGGIFGLEHDTGMMNVVSVDKSQGIISTSYMGTKDLKTAKEDLKALFEGLFSKDGDSEIEDSDVSGKVSKGFQQCYRAVRDAGSFDKVEELAKQNPDFPIVFSGHSLGGATALISAAGFMKDKPDFIKRVAIFTYGAPRAGDQKFQESLYETVEHRMANFRHHGDPVPGLPLRVMEYWNPGNTFDIEPGKTWTNGGDWVQTEAPNNKGRYENGKVHILWQAIKKSFVEHTGYFVDEIVPVRRTIEWAIQSRGLSKRSEQDVEDVRKIWKKIDELEDDDLEGDELEDDAQEGDEAVGKLLKAMGLDDDDMKECAKGLEDLSDKEDKKDGLRAMLLASQEVSSGGVTQATKDFFNSVWDTLTNSDSESNPGSDPGSTNPTEPGSSPPGSPKPEEESDGSVVGDIVDGVGNLLGGGDNNAAA